MIKITKAWLKKENACDNGIKWYETHKLKSLKTIIPALLKSDHFDYARWLLSRLMTHSQQVQWAIYSAELVIESFEKKYPQDDRPRNAIEAAKAFLRGEITTNAVNAAADAAYAAADAVYVAADAAYAVNAAAYAAYAAAYAAVHVAYAAANTVNTVNAAAEAAYAAVYAAYAAANTVNTVNAADDAAYAVNAAAYAAYAAAYAAVHAAYAAANAVNAAADAAYAVVEKKVIDFAMKLLGEIQ